MIIAVFGAGTMGRSIALSALLAHHEVRLYDVNSNVVAAGLQYISEQMSKMQSKGKLSEEEMQHFSNNISTSSDIGTIIQKADIVIEAIIENYEIKHALFADIENAGLSAETILATNTSSLSVNVLSSKRKYPAQFIGLHFFNPAHLMKLVEIVKSSSTCQAAIDKSIAWCDSMKKVSVIAQDVPGFIVNRVARNFYNESMRIATEHAATPLQIDLIMKSAGFKMGPFELMDLIGNDINLEVTKSVAAQYFNEPRFTPSLMQQEIVNAGKYGKKTGSGFYDYSTDK